MVSKDNSVCGVNINSALELLTLHLELNLGVKITPKRISCNLNFNSSFGVKITL